MLAIETRVDLNSQTARVNREGRRKLLSKVRTNKRIALMGGEQAAKVMTIVGDTRAGAATR